MKTWVRRCGITPLILNLCIKSGFVVIIKSQLLYFPKKFVFIER